MLKVQKSFWISIKLLVFVLVVFFLSKQLLKFSRNDFSNLSLSQPSYFIGAFLLVFLNWGIELLKWLVTVKLIAPKTSMKAVTQSLLAGISTGVVTPNRIGNFIGRMMFFKGKNRGLIIIGTLYGNLAQFIASVCLGSIGLFYLKNNYITHDYSVFAILFSFLIVVLAVILYIVYPFASLEFFTRFKSFQRLSNLIVFFQAYAKRLLTPLLLFSVIRYFIFVLQFLFVLLSFGISYSPSLVLALFLLYLLTTLTPSILFGKLFVRETVALLILGSFVSNPAVIIVSSLSLWVINLGMPSLVGLFYLLRFKRFSEE